MLDISSLFVFVSVCFNIYHSSARVVVSYYGIYLD